MNIFDWLDISETELIITRKPGKKYEAEFGKSNNHPTDGLPFMGYKENRYSLAVCSIGLSISKTPNGAVQLLSKHISGKLLCFGVWSGEKRKYIQVPQLNQY